MQQPKPEAEEALLRYGRQQARARQRELQLLKEGRFNLEAKCQEFNEGIRVPGASKEVLQGGEVSLEAIKAGNTPEAATPKPAAVVRMEAQPLKPNALRKTTSFPTPAPA